MVAAAVIAGGAVLGAGASLLGSSQAAGAAKDAAAMQQQQASLTRADLAPFTDAGKSVLGSLTALAQSGPTGGGPDYLAQAAGAQPGQMTQAQLEATPGYQFNLAQGLKAAQSSAAARGLGVSGAALKGAASFATGLADNTYQTQFNNAQTRFQNLLNLNTGQQGLLTNQYNRLVGAAQLGESAGAQTGAIGQQAANAAGGYLSAAGQYSAAGIMGAGNALSSGVNNYLGYNYLDKLTAAPTTGGYPKGA